MTAHYRTADGEWQEFEAPPLFMHQTTANACAMLDGFLPVVLKVDGGYICSSSIVTEVRRNQPPEVNVITFRQIKADDRPFYETLGVRV